MARSMPIDMAYEENTLEEALSAVRARYGVDVAVVSERGPGGGWPTVQLEADESVLHDALTNGWGIAPGEIAEWVEKA